MSLLRGWAARAAHSRDLEALRLVANGQGNRQIGQTLGLTEHTPRFHVNGILNRIGASTRTR
jgi:DNA-binding NarL/FixJ family response regulator